MMRIVPASYREQGRTALLLFRLAEAPAICLGTRDELRASQLAIEQGATSQRAWPSYLTLLVGRQRLSTLPPPCACKTQLSAFLSMWQAEIGRSLLFTSACCRTTSSQIPQVGDPGALFEEAVVAATTARPDITCHTLIRVLRTRNNARI